MKKTKKSMIALLFCAIFSLAAIAPVVSCADSVAPPAEDYSASQCSEDKTLPFDGELDELEGIPVIEPEPARSEAVGFIMDARVADESRTEEPLGDVVTYESVSSDGTDGETCDAPTDDEPVDYENETSNTKQTERDSNFFTDLYAEFSPHLGDLLSALSFAASLIIMIACKKSVLPGFRGAQEAISISYDKMTKENESTMSAVIEGYDLLSRRMEELERSVVSLSESSSEYIKRLESIDYERERTALREILLTQVDMLYNVFISSSLPQYQKDGVGRAIEKMRDVVSRND